MNNEETSQRSPLENIMDIVRGLNEDRELRKLAAQERSAERKAEKDYRSKGRKVPEKKKGPKMSATPRSERDGKEYADHILSSPALKNMREDAPVNNVSSGHIAGAVPGEPPPVFMKKKYRPPILARGLMPGSRKRWTPKKDGK
jgi:hypothetical protein